MKSRNFVPCFFRFTLSANSWRVFLFLFLCCSLQYSLVCLVCLMHVFYLFLLHRPRPQWFISHLTHVFSFFPLTLYNVVLSSYLCMPAQRRSSRRYPSQCELHTECCFDTHIDTKKQNNTTLRGITQRSSATPVKRMFQVACLWGLSQWSDTSDQC